MTNNDGFAVAISEIAFNSLVLFGEQLVKTGFLPASIKTGAQAASIILTGREMGLQPMTSLRLISIVNGKPTLAAELQLGMFQRRGGHFKWIESTNEKAVLWLKNSSGDEHTETFTIRDATLAGLSGKQVWKQYPKMMLRARCATGGLRAIDPGNNLYDPEEIGGTPCGPYGQVFEEAELVDPPALQDAWVDPVPDPPATTQAPDKAFAFDQTLSGQNRHSEALEKCLTSFNEVGISELELKAYFHADLSDECIPILRTIYAQAIAESKKNPPPTGHLREAFGKNLGQTEAA